MIDSIISLQNATVKLAATLQQKKRRDDSGLFVVEGVRLCEELLSSSWVIECGLYTEAAEKQERASRVIQIAARRCVMTRVSEAVFAKAAETKQPQGVLLIARQTIVPLGQLLSGENQLLVVIDSVQDPGNMGTLIRTADAAGADAVIVMTGSSDPFNGKALRASMGSLFHLPVTADVSSDELIAACKQRKIRLCATALDSAGCYLKADLRSSLAVVFGNEGNGVSLKLLAQADERIYIPIYGQAESLNVTTAAAIILYEAARQRRT